MRLSGTKTGSANQYNGLGDQLYDLGGARPTLDLNFASNGSLVDSVTGKTLVGHTRASSGTYVGSDGLIKTATTNLIGYSEDSSQWTVNDSTVTNTTVEAPDSSLTAISFEENLVTSAHYTRISGFSTAVANTKYTMSVYAKAGARDYVTLWADQNRFGATAKQTFNIANGTLGDSLDVDDKAITSVGNGWYRCSMTFTSGAAPTGTLYLTVLTNDSSDTSNNKAGISGIACYLWGAQLEQSSTVGEYVKTTSTINSAPRFDHDPTTGESLGLLVEESRTNLAVYSEDLTTLTGRFNLILTSKTDTTCPVTSTVYDMQGDNGELTYVSYTANVTSGVTYTVSRFVRYVSGSEVYGFAAFSFFPTFQGFHGFTETSPGNLSVTNSSIQSYQYFGNGWYRIIITDTASTSGTVAIQNSISTPANYPNANTGLQFEVGSFPTSYIPTEGSAVTRAADLASISGNDFGVTNLLSYSEEFDQYGSLINASLIANAATAPNGTLSADKLIENTSNAAHRHRDIENGADTSRTYSVYAKSAGRDLVLNAQNPDSGGYRVYFNLSTGTSTIITNTSATGSHSITEIGNGWYRCSITYSFTESDAYYLDRLVGFSGSDSYTGDGTSGIYIWGAQLEQGTTATPYIKSDVTFSNRASTATYYDADGVIQTAAVDEARTAAYLPDGNGNFISAGPLLLEGAGTNLLLRSEEFNSASWTRSNTTASVDVTTAPDGTTTAEKIVETTATSEHNVRQDTTSQSAGTYTFSIFAKAGERSFIQFVATGVLGSYRANFDLSNGTLGSVDSQLAGSIVDVGDGWYRCIVSATSSTSGTLRAQWNIVTSSTAARVESYAGDGTSGIYIWGAQLEASPYATSYIPTAGSQVTRAADVSDGGANTFGNSWYRQDEGTVYSEHMWMTTSDYGTVWGLDDGSGNNETRLIGWNSGTDRAPTITVGGTGQIQWTNNSYSANILYRYGIAYKQNDVASSRNGALPLTDGIVSLPSVTRLAIGSTRSTAFELNGTIKRLTYWPSRLPNDTLQTITL